MEEMKKKEHHQEHGGGHGHKHHEEHHCSHDHAHHHGHSPKEAVTVVLHDGTAVGTVKIPVDQILDETLPKIQEKLVRIAGQIEEAGGFIGHIKGILQETGRMCRLSLVEAGNGIDTEMIDAPRKSELECVFIVFNLETEQLKKMLEAEFLI